jgi:phosphoribosylformylglycinamidine synthase
VLSQKQIVQSVHDISEGGFFIACLESAMAGNLGFDVCTPGELRLDAALFGENQSRVIVSVPAQNAAEIMALAQDFNVPALHVGTVTDSEIEVNGMHWGTLNTFKQTYDNSIGDILNA